MLCIIVGRLCIPHVSILNRINFRKGAIVVHIVLKYNKIMLIFHLISGDLIISTTVNRCLADIFIIVTFLSCNYIHRRDKDRDDCNSRNYFSNLFTHITGSGNVACRCSVVLLWHPVRYDTSFSFVYVM
jgi:hypothetical protein